MSRMASKRNYYATYGGIINRVRQSFGAQLEAGAPPRVRIAEACRPGHRVSGRQLSVGGCK